MNPLLVLSIQCTFSMFVFFLLIKWYVLPKTSKETKYKILAFLLLVNVFRYLPLSLFMPGQISDNFPEYLKEIIALGDFLAGVLALIALLAIKRKHKRSIALVWLFSIISILDIVGVLTLAMKEKVYEIPLGTNYFTVSVYVPMLIVIQVTILKIISNKNYKNNG